MPSKTHTMPSPGAPAMHSCTHTQGSHLAADRLVQGVGPQPMRQQLGEQIVAGVGPHALHAAGAYTAQPLSCQRGD